ncbi:MAG: fused MFS/spermidine synthase [Pirellulaceae bacterium]
MPDLPPTSNPPVELDHERGSPEKLMPLLMLLFVGSGCSALIYEIIWLQMLQLLLGSTAISLGILLGVFMGGMCLGSLLLPRLVSSRHHPILVYAVLEAGIAILAMAILWGMPSIEWLYESLHQGGASLAQRGFIAALCLLPPTLLMGATLPAVSRWVEATPRGVSWLGLFYGSNIFGAVAGCLLAGFYLLRVFDMSIATYVAVAINASVVLLALAIGIWTRQSRTLSSAQPNPETATQPDIATSVPSQSAATSSPSTPSVRRPRLVYLALAFSGCAALGSEVVWTRLLSLLMGGTVYTFSIILATYLAGLGIGSTCGAVLARTSSSPVRSLAWAQFWCLLAIAWSGNLLTKSLPHWPIDPSIAGSIWYTFQMDLARSACAILPATILWGASFPLALAVISSGREDSGKIVGRLYAANTFGAILGALLFSMVAIPNLGTLQAQYILLALTAIAALLSFAAGNTRPTPSTSAGPNKSLAMQWIGPISTCGAAISLGATLTEMPWSVIAYGRYAATWERTLEPSITPPDRVADHPGDASDFCLMTAEGMNVSVAVTQNRAGVRRFHGGGKVQASSSPEDMRLQRMLGHIPALIHENPRDVLVVACGAGVTAGSFLPHPEVERIVICDIEPMVPTRVTPYFADVNFDVVGDANQDRVRIEFDDGRHFIRTTQQKFDIITSDPIDPWVKGCASLNTIEYYEMCRSKLKPGGIMALWMPLYESDSETLKSVVATFYEVFPRGILWTNDVQGKGYDAVLFGQVGGSKVDLDRVGERLKNPDQAAVVKSLREVGFTSIEQLFATHAGDAKGMQAWSAGAQLNTDRDLRLQYLAGLSVNSYVGDDLLEDILSHYRFPETLFRGSEKAMETLREASILAGRPE